MDVNIYPNPNFSGGVAKPSSKLGMSEWLYPLYVITYSCPYFGLASSCKETPPLRVTTTDGRSR